MLSVLVFRLATPFGFSDPVGLKSCGGRTPPTYRRNRRLGQPQDRQSTRPRCAADVPRVRRRGDRMMGWMAPLRHLSAKLLSDRISSEWEPSMGEVNTIG